MLNTELGIPCSGNSLYSNAVGGFNRQIIEKAKAEAAKQEALRQEEMNRTRQYITRGFGNAILGANSLEALEAALDKLAQEKRNVGGGTFMGVVGLFGRHYRKTRQQHTCTTTATALFGDDCRKITLEAIQEFEKSNQSLVDEKRKQLSQITPPAPTPTPAPKPAPIPPVAAIVATQPPVGMATATEDMQGSTSQLQDNTDKNSVTIVGKQINKSTLIFGGVGLALAGLLIYKLK